MAYTIYSETGTDAAIAAHGSGIRVVGVGDSHVEGVDGEGHTTDWRIDANQPIGSSQYGWGIVLTKGTVLSVGNWGKGGDRTDEVLARMTGPLTSGANVAVVQMGTNDARQAIPLATTISNYTQVIDQLRGGGIRPIIVGLPPINDPSSVRDDMDAINNWLRSYCARERLRFVEIADLMINTADRTFAAGMTVEGVHLSATAVQMAGQRIADALDELATPVGGVYCLSNVDAQNLIKNPLALTDTDANGVPDLFGTLGNGVGVTRSIEPVDGWMGNAVKIAAAASTDIAQTTQTIHFGASTFNPGDLLRFSCRGKGDGGIGYFVRVSFAASATGHSYTELWDMRSTLASEIGAVQELVVPVGTTDIALSMAAESGTGTVWFGQPTLVNLTRLGITEPLSTPGSGW